MQLIVLRPDMSKGKTAAQVAHGAMQFIRRKRWWGPFLFFSRWEWEWLETGMTKIVLCLEKHSDVVDIMLTCKEAGIPAKLVIDEGRTEFGGVHTPTVWAIGPAPDELLKPITGHLKLL